MIQIFGLLFFIILICLIYLHYQGKISKNIPIIFMFFLILIIPFQYLEKNNLNKESFSSYDQIMNSSLDIFYTNENKQKKILDPFKKYPLIGKPINVSLTKKIFGQIELYLYSASNLYNGLYVIYNGYWYDIYTTYLMSQNLFTYFIEDDFKTNSTIQGNIRSRIKKFENLADLKNLLENTPKSSYIIINANKIDPIFKSSTDIKNIFIKDYKFPDSINNNNGGSLIVVLSKSYDNTYTKLIDRSVNNNDFINLFQIIKIEPNQIITNGGEVFQNVETNDIIKSISNEPLINSKINIISPAVLNQNYSLSITVENNESFVYLSSRKLEDEIVKYSKNPKESSGGTSTTYLDTQRPQFWTFEPVTKIITDPLVVFIKTYSKPTFYLDAEFENGVMVIKAKRFKAGLRQQWEIIKNKSDINKIKIKHLKSGMYLGYSDFDGYLYNDDGSVFLTKSENYEWNIKQVNERTLNKNIIEDFQPNRVNSFIGLEVPTDYGIIENPVSRISRNINGKDIVIESKGRTIWESEYAPIWNGKWIYYGTVASYKATLNINTVKFLIINIDPNGNGQIIDEYLNFKMNIINAGSNILTGLIPSGEYKDYRAILKLIPTNLQYTDVSKPFPVKMRYIIEKDSSKINLSSGNVNNMQAYSTKFVGDKLILANFLEASGIQTDANLAFSSQDLQKINKNIREQTEMPSYIKNANRFMKNKIKNYKLLYKGSVNGFNATVFHQLCDNKGPTITVALLKDGRYIGAYSPISWGITNNNYISNPDVFLYDVDDKYTAGNLFVYAILQNSSYGPIFGGGHDFMALPFWSSQTLYTYAWSFLNNNKGPLGVPRYSSQNYQLKDLEVYGISI
jgi:hypothetical protein